MTRRFLLSLPFVGALAKKFGPKPKTAYAVEDIFAAVDRQMKSMTGITPAMYGVHSPLENPYIPGTEMSWMDGFHAESREIDEVHRRIWQEGSDDPS